MTNFNFLSKSSSQSCSHSSVTLASTVGSPSVHRRGIMLKLISVLVLILTFGVGNVWGETTTYTCRTSAGTDTKKIESTNSWVASAGASYNNDGAFWGCNSSSKTITIECTNISDPITEIVVEGKRNKANFTYSISATVGGSAFGTTFSKSGNSTYTTNTLSNSNGKTGTVVLTITAAGASSQGGSIWVKSIKVTTAASCSVDPTVGNIMNDVSSITASGATFTTSAGVSAGSNCSLSEVGFVYGTSSNPTITIGTKVTIANYTSGNLSKSVTGLDDNTTYYVRAFATNGHGTAYSDEKSFTTPELAKYTVQFSTGEGNPTKDALTEASAGAGITLPTAVVPHCSGWTFAGWSETNVVSETTTAPTTLLAAGSTYHPASNCTLYAVYSRSETGDPTEQSIKTIGFESTEGFSSVSSYQNSTPYTGGSNPEWSMTYGGPCAASGAARTGSQTAQFRIYSSGGGFGELKTTGSFANVTKFTFYAKTANTTNTKLTTYYSTDGSTWTTLTADRSIANSYTQYTETINVEGVNTVYIKFSPTGSTRPASSNYAISIDDIEVFGMVTSSTTYYISETECCQELAPINGSFFLNHFLDHFGPFWTNQQISVYFS